MRLRKASAWYYNKGKSHVVINELGLTLYKGDVVDLFALNPNLTWEQYQYSATKGVLAQKKDKIVPLPGPPAKLQSNVKSSEIIKTTPIPSRSRSTFTLGKDNEDYLAAIESDFPADSQPLAQEELWKAERDKYMETLKKSETGEFGEVFSDNLFEDEYLDGLTD